MKFIKNITYCIVLIGCFFAYGCNKNETMEKNQNSIDVVLHHEQADKWLQVGKEINDFNYSEGIDKPVIFVNNLPISRREVETKRKFSIYFENISFNEEIYSLIKNAALKAEAKKLMIEPPNDKIETYIKSVESSLRDESEGVEDILYYIKGRGISVNEYINEVRIVAYDMYQREALWEFQKTSYENYEQYISELLKNADIEVLDDSLNDIVETVLK